jgi:hypothetical protein
MDAMGGSIPNGSGLNGVIFRNIIRAGTSYVRERERESARERKRQKNIMGWMVGRQAG